MLNLIACHPPTLDKRGAPPQVGIMNTWINAYNRDLIAASGRYWALDNGCFVAYRPDKIMWALRHYARVPRCLFAVVPDVVRDHDRTLTLWRQWISTYHALGYRAAFVLQNGLRLEDIPWSGASALFIGGDNRFKYSDVVREAVREAKSRGLWVHHGRVNTRGRIIYSRAIGVDSFDGTGFSRFYDDRMTATQPYWQGDTKQWLLF